MASCLVTRNTEGKITEVKTPEGKPSQLFNAIHSIPFLGEAETSLRIFSNMYSKSIQDTFKDAKSNMFKNGEPKLFFKSPDNKIYNSLDNLLIDGSLGETYMGFKNPTTNEFISIASFSTNATAKAEFIATSIREGLMSPKRVLGTDGVTRFQGEGQYDITKKASAYGIKVASMIELGEGNTIANEDGTVEFAFDKDYVVGVTKNETKMIRIEDIPTEANQLENKVDLLATNTIATSTVRPLMRGQKPAVKGEDRALKQSLLNFLANMGFEFSTLESYRKNYNTRYGIDPDINAIADMANKVVAIAEGMDITEELLEEVAHIAIEAYAEQASIVGALSEVDSTPEYTEFADEYRTKYSKFYKGIELEDQVRKEILGIILAKSIKTQFSTETRKENEVSLISRLQNIWNNFINFIKAGYQPYLADSISELNARIADSILSQEMSKFNTEFKSPNFFYSLAGKKTQDISKTLQVTRDIINNVYRSVIKTPAPSQSQIDRIYDDMNEVEILEAINAINGITYNQLSNVNSAANEALANGDLVSAQDDMVFSSVTSATMPLILQLTNKLENLKVSDNLIDQKKLIVDDLKKTGLLYNEVTPKMDTDYSAYAKRLFDETMSRSQLTEKQKEELWEKTLTGLADQSFMSQYFGITSQSENMLINMIGARVAKMTADTNQELITIANGFIKRIFDKGLEKFQKTIVQLKNGKMTAWYESMWDFQAEQDYAIETRIKLLTEISQRPEDEVRKLVKDRLSNKSILKTDENLITFKERFRKATEGNRERAKVDAYYEALKAKQDLVDMSPASVSYRQDISNERQQIYQSSNAIVGGKLDRTKMSPAAIAAEKALKQRMATSGNILDATGNTREGLALKRYSDLTAEELKDVPEWKKSFYDDAVQTNPEVKITIHTMPKASLSFESRLAFDTASMTVLYQIENKDKTVDGFSQGFSDKVNSLPESERFDFVEANASIGLSQEYFDRIGEGQSYEAKAEEYISTIDDATDRKNKEGELKLLREYQTQKNNILKQKRDARNPLEIHGEDMSEPLKETVRKLEDEIFDLKKSIGMPFEEGVEMDSVKKVNAAFTKDKIESGKSKFDFAMMHMSANSKRKVVAFQAAIDILLDPYNGVKKTKSGYERFIKQQVENNSKLQKQLVIFNSDTATKKEIVEATKKIKEILFEEYAMANVASYYTKFEPKGYSEAIAQLKSGELSIENFLTKDGRAEMLAADQTGVLKFIDIRPDYTWMEEVDADTMNNPRYMKEGMFKQINMEKYLNKDFFNKYGINIEKFKANPTEDLNTLTPTKNQEEFELLKEVYNMRVQVINKYGDQGMSNPYMRPQVNKSKLEGNVGLNVKEWYKDFTQNREDEKEFGEQIEGENVDSLGVRIIPKYFQREVDDTDALTGNIVTAALADIKQAILYDNRKKAEKDFKALEWQIANQKFREKGRVGTKIMKFTSGQTSSYLAMAKESIGHHLYGIKQSRQLRFEVMGREVDLTKSIASFQAIVSYSNLAFNPFVDFTSGTSAVMNNLSDRFAGDYYHGSSATLADKDIAKYVTAYMAESGKMDKDSELNNLTELFNMGDFEGRIKDSSFSRAARFGTNMAFKLSKTMNIPVVQRTILTTINDYRYVVGEDGRGQFLNWEEFYINRKNAAIKNEDYGRTKASIEAEFINLKDESLKSYLTIDRSGIKFNDKWKQRATENEVNPEEWFKKEISYLSNRIKTLAQNIDGTINENDQVAAQRDVLLNVFMMHSGWLPLMLTKRFKKQSWNVALNRFEEGHYTSLVKFLPALIKGRKEGKSFRTMFDELEINQKKNIKRSAIEVGMWTGIMLLGVSLMAPDDDDEYFTSLAKYIYLRNASEFSTQQIFGIPGAVIDKLKNPIVPIRTIEALEPVQLLGDIFTLDGTSLMERLQKHTILKRPSQVMDIEKQISSFQHFNVNSLYWLSPEFSKEPAEK